MNNAAWDIDETVLARNKTCRHLLRGSAYDHKKPPDSTTGILLHIVYYDL
jgi:hypothetical protein